MGYYSRGKVMIMGYAAIEPELIKSVSLMSSKGWHCRTSYSWAITGYSCSWSRSFYGQYGNSYVLDRSISLPHYPF
jgi:hypothetical protein